METTTEPSQTSSPPPRRDLKYYLSRLGPAGPLAIMASTVPPLGSVLLFYYIHSVSHWLRSHGARGAVVFVVAFAFLGGLNLLPTYVYSALGGWAFGLRTGLAAAMGGIMLAATIGYFVGRKVTGERVVGIFQENVRWNAIYQALLRSSFGRTLWIVTLVRLPPNSPFAVTNLVLSAAKTSFFAYALGTLLGMLPRTALVVWFGAQMGKDEFKLTDQTWFFWLSLAAGALVVGVIGLIARQAVKKVVEQHHPANAPPRALSEPVKNS